MKNKSPFSHKYFIYYPVVMAIEKTKNKKPLYLIAVISVK